MDELIYHFPETEDLSDFVMCPHCDAFDPKFQLYLNRETNELTGVCGYCRHNVFIGNMDDDDTQP